MSHVIAVVATLGTDLVIDLRRYDYLGTAQVGKMYYKACKLKVTAKQSGASKSTCNVAPIVVADGDDPPSAPTLSITGSAKGLTYLDSTLAPSVEIGQSYGPGHTPQVFKEIVATHLLITPVATGYVEIVVD